MAAALNPIKKLAGQTAIYGLSSIVGRFLNYLLVPLHTLVFAKAQFGVITEMYAYVAFLIVLLTYGMETAYFRFSTQPEWTPKSVYSQAILSITSTSTFFIILCIAFAQPIADWLMYSNYPEYVVWFAVIVGLDALSAVPLAKLRKEDRPGKFALVNLVNVGVNIGLTLFFLLYCLPTLQAEPDHPFLSKYFDADIGVGYVFIANLIASVVKFLLLAPEMFDIELKFNKQLWKKMLIYALPLLGVGVAGIINETLDRIMLKRLLIDTYGEVRTMSELGVYGACYKLSMLIILFIQAFRYAAEPFFFNQEKEKGATHLYAKVLNYFTLVCAVLFVGITLFIDVIKYFLASEEYWAGLDVVPILLLANICLGIYFNLSIWYKLTGKTIWGTYIAVIGAIITIGLNWWWIPIYGYMGSAVATLVCYASMVVISFVIGQRKYTIPYQVLKVLSYIGGAIGVYVLSQFWQNQSNGIKYSINSILFLGFTATLIYIEYKSEKSNNNGNIRS